MATRFVIIGLFSCMLFSTTAYSSPLKDLLHSKRIANLERRNKMMNNKLELNNKREESPWISKNSNFGKIYTKGIHPTKVMNWVFSAATSHGTRDVKHKCEKEFCRITGKLTKGKKNDMDFSLLIPHPKHQEAIEYGLVSAFRSIVPTGKDLEFEEKLTLGRGKSKARLFQIRGGSCSIIIDAAKGAKLHIYSKKCQRMTDLTDLAEQLDIRRLNRKLNT